RSERPTVFSTKRACPSCGRSFAELDPRLFSYNSKHGWCESCYGTGLEVPEVEEETTASMEAAADGWDDEATEICASCAGKRLNPIALSVRFRERSVANLAA